MSWSIIKINYTYKMNGRNKLMAKDKKAVVAIAKEPTV